MQSRDMNVSDPIQAIKMLRAVAQDYAESQLNLQSDWQDDQAGRVWGEFARILERAADSMQRAADKYFR